MRSFTVTPMKQQLVLEPGATYEGYITVANPASSEEDITYKASVSPYVLDRTDGVESAGDRSTMTQIVDWVKLKESTGTLAPNATGRVYYTIEVPTDAPAGGQYVMIGVSLDEGEKTAGTANIGETAELASVIYAEVAGETVHRGQLLTSNIPGFVTELPAVLSSKVVNTGNVHETARLDISVKNVLTGEILYPYTENPKPDEEIVMPGTERTITRDVTVLSGLGIYEVTQNVTYMGETTYNTRVLTVCPVWFIFLVIATIVTGGWTVAMLVKRNKNKKRLL